MSYYTRLELEWDDADYTLGTLTPEMVSDAAVTFVTQRNWALDVLDDLRASAAGQGLAHPGYNAIDAESLVDLLRAVSLAFPTVTFSARGIGEDMFDTWMRTVREGEVIRQFGPFEASTLDRPASSEPHPGGVIKKKAWWKV